MRDKATRAEPEKRITIRFKMSEFQQLQANMEATDYLSYAKFLRELALNKKVTIKKKAITDPAIRKKINELSVRYSRVGSNYNQVVKSINSRMNATKKNGDPVINTKYLTYQLDKLETLTNQMIQLHNQLIETVNRLGLRTEEQ